MLLDHAVLGPGVLCPIPGLHEAGPPSAPWTALGCQQLWRMGMVSSRPSAWFSSSGLTVSGCW